MGAGTIIAITICAAVAAVVIAICVWVIIERSSFRGSKSTEYWTLSTPYDGKKVVTLDKDPDRDFVVLNFTDVQFNDVLDIGRADFTYKTMDELVKRVRPDLITVTGDVVWALPFTRRSVMRFILHMDKYRVPWAPVFGNHDAEGNATLEWQGDRFEEAEHCLFDRGPTDLYGVGNYFVNIFEDGTPIYSLCFMDNGRYIDYGDRTAETYVDYAQIAWYKWNIEGLNAEFGTSVPSMSFSHFAFPEMREAVEKYGILSDDGRYVIPEDMGQGSCAYLPGAAPVNSGFFETAKASGLTHAFFGHDHENDARITVDGVTLSYGLKTGPSPRPWNSAKEYGGTVITIGDGGVSVRNEVVASAD